MRTKAIMMYLIYLKMEFKITTAVEQTTSEKAAMAASGNRYFA